MRHLAFLAAGLLVACSSTFGLQPPARYHYVGLYALRTVATDDIPHYCAGSITTGEPAGPVVACFNSGTRVVTVPNPCEWHDPYAQVFCHEIGHANGWAADHPRD